MDGTYVAVKDNLQFPLPENIVARFENIEEYAGTGKEVVLGIRPEDAKLTRGGAYKATFDKALKGETPYSMCELEGGIYVTVGGQSNFFKGEQCELDIDLTRVYLFDGKTSLTLLKKDGGYKNTGFADADFTPLPKN